jgi:hypothetical protein
MSFNEFLSVALGTWILVIAANQFSCISRRLPASQLITPFLPNWKFFAPEPGTTDVRLAFRERVKCRWSAWTEVSPPRRSAIRGLWNLDKFDTKALFDTVGCLFEEANSMVNPSVLSVSWPYLALLEHVTQASSTEATELQFALLESSGFANERTLETRFVSRTHRVG